MLKIIIPVVKHHGIEKLEGMITSNSPGFIYVDECKMHMCGSKYTEQEYLKSWKTPFKDPLIQFLLYRVQNRNPETGHFLCKVSQQGRYRRGFTEQHGAVDIALIRFGTWTWVLALLLISQPCGLQVPFNPALSLCKLRGLVIKFSEHVPANVISLSIETVKKSRLVSICTLNICCTGPLIVPTCIFL